MSAHHCHALQCERPCPPKYLMCGGHWRLVAPAIQREVYEHFDARQCADVPDRPLPTAAWHHAANKVIAWVAWREGRMTAQDADAWVAKRARLENHAALAEEQGRSG